MVSYYFGMMIPALVISLIWLVASTLFAMDYKKKYLVQPSRPVNSISLLRKDRAKKGFEWHQKSIKYATWAIGYSFILPLTWFLLPVALVVWILFKSRKITKETISD